MKNNNYCFLIILLSLCSLAFAPDDTFAEPVQGDEETELFALLHALEMGSFKVMRYKSSPVLIYKDKKLNRYYRDSLSDVYVTLYQFNNAISFIFDGWMPLKDFSQESRESYKDFYVFMRNRDLPQSISYFATLYKTLGELENESQNNPQDLIEIAQERRNLENMEVKIHQLAVERRKTPQAVLTTGVATIKRNRHALKEAIKKQDAKELKKVLKRPVQLEQLFA